MGIRSLKLAVSAAAMAACLAVPAQAQSVYDWSGSYLGVKGGYAFGDVQLNSGALTSNFDVDGFLVGLMSSWNFQSGNIVFGLDSDMSFADIDGSLSPAAGQTCFAATSCKAEFDYLSTTRGRVGYAIGQVLPYATAGIATGYAEFNSGAAHFGNFMFGFAGGGGVEFAMGDGWHGRAEYLYVDFGKESGSGFSADVEELHLVRVGISKNITPIIDAILGR